VFERLEVVFVEEQRVGASWFDGALVMDRLLEVAHGVSFKQSDWCSASSKRERSINHHDDCW